MADKSHIEWTDATWNPITGCDIVSSGCTNCYAMKLAGGRLQHHPSRAGLTKPSKAGPVWTGEVRLNEGWLSQPIHWKKPRRIFVCAHGDLFAEGVPDAWIDMVVAIMHLSPWHTYQVLTKRSQRMREYFAGLAANLHDRLVATGMYDLFPDGVKLPLPNVWLGVSAENQIMWDERVPELLWTIAAKRFVSVEPMLSPIDPGPIDVMGGYSELNPLRWDTDCEDDDGEPFPDVPPLDWIIVGGESGAGARPMHPDWVRRLRDACEAEGVDFFFKQWGAWGADPDLDRPFRATEVTHPLGSVSLLQSSQGRYAVAWERLDDDGVHTLGTQLKFIGKKASGRLLDGIEHNAMPEVGA
jgi:protein gp37